MNYKECAKKVRAFIKGVVDYHKLCNFQQCGLIILTLQMTSFALPEYSSKEVGDCLVQLADKGQINIISKEPLMFTPKDICNN